MRRPARVRLLAPAALVFWAFLGVARAAGPDADAVFAELDADTAHRALYAGPLARAKDALTRAKAADRAGDARHGAMLRAAALEWLGTARDSIRTAAEEARAEAAEKSAGDLETKIVRGRALLEETVARRSRAQSLLEQLDAKPSSSAGKPSGSEPVAAPKSKPAPTVSPSPATSAHP